MSVVLLVVSGLLALCSGQTFEPIYFSLPDPPKLSGPLAPNYALYYVEKLHTSQVQGPSSFAFLGDDVFTVTTDGKVLNVAACPPQTVADLRPPGCTTMATCGLLTSIRLDITGSWLLVLDAYRGLFRVDPNTGVFQQMYSSSTAVGGRKPKYLNGLVQTPSGYILMSDSSDKWDIARDLYIILEGRTSGRILAMDPNNWAQITEFVKDIAFPNGLEITSDGTQLLVAESGRARILSVSLQAVNFGQVDIFSDNLPGCPANIRRTERGTFWAALTLIRHADIGNSMDYYSNNPYARYNTYLYDSLQTIRTYYPYYGMVVEIDADGNVLRSLHDPTGQVYQSNSEAYEHEGLLYIAHSLTAYVGRIILSEGLTIDSVVQVMRSRCEITDAQIEETKQKLRDQLSSTTTTTTTPTSSSTTTPTTESTTPSSTTPSSTTPSSTTPSSTTPSSTTPSSTTPSSTTPPSTTPSSTTPSSTTPPSTTPSSTTPSSTTTTSTTTTGTPPVAG